MQSSVWSYLLTDNCTLSFKTCSIIKARDFSILVELMMNTALEEVKLLLNKMPQNSTLEDIQYHLYVVEKIEKGLDRAKKEGTLTQDEVERKFSKWTTQ